MERTARSASTVFVNSGSSKVALRSVAFVHARAVRRNLSSFLILASILAFSSFRSDCVMGRSLDSALRIAVHSGRAKTNCVLLTLGQISGARRSMCEAVLAVPVPTATYCRALRIASGCTSIAPPKRHVGGFQGWHIRRAMPRASRACRARRPLGERLRSDRPTRRKGQRWSDGGRSRTFRTRNHGTTGDLAVVRLGRVAKGDTDWRRVLRIPVRM